MSAATVEADVRAFAAQFPTPQVLRAVRLAEAGELSWEQIYRLFRRSLQEGLASVR